MNQRRFRIEYGASSLKELDRLPAKVRTQVLRKIDRLHMGWSGTSSGSRMPAVLSASAWATIASCLM